MVGRSVCSLAATLLVASAVGGSPAEASAPTVHLALGDSVAAGAGAPPGRGYVERYFEYLRDPARGGVDRLVNLAEPAQTSVGMRFAGGQLDRAIRVIRRRSNVVVVTLTIGGNDALHGLCPAGWGDGSCPFEANLRAILDALGAALARDPGPERLQVMTYYNPLSGAGSPLEAAYDAGLLGADGRIDCTRTGADIGLDDVIACVGADSGAQVVDPYPTAMAVGPAFSTDGIHPSAAGHAAIACLFEHPERAGAAAPCRVLSLSGPDVQRPLRRRAVTVTVRTSAASTITTSARVRIPGTAPDVGLGPVTADLAARTRTAVEIPLPPAARRPIRRALRRHGRLSAAVTVTAADGGGRSTDETRTFGLIA